MDPISIAASVTALAIHCGQIIILCNSIVGRQHAARRALVSLRTESAAYQASLHTIQDLLIDQSGPLAEYLGSNEQWARSFDTALTACGLTFSILKYELDRAISSSVGTISYALKEDDIKKLIEELRGQRSAVQLLIQTLQL
jgi:hypothetical protein